MDNIDCNIEIDIDNPFTFLAFIWQAYHTITKAKFKEFLECFVTNLFYLAVLEKIPFILVLFLYSSVFLILRISQVSGKVKICLFKAQFDMQFFFSGLLLLILCF